MITSNASDKIKHPVSKIEMPDDFNHLALPMMSFLRDKLVLTGSLSLKLLGIPIRRKNFDSSDFDFGLKAPLTVDEFVHFKDFFELESNYEQMEEYDAMVEQRDPKPYTPENELENRLIRLTKRVLVTDPKTNRQYEKTIKIDIFNFDYMLPRDIIQINYSNFLLSIIHPSVTISYKSKYAFQQSNGQYDKHCDDLKFLLEHFQKYRSTVIQLWENMFYDRTIVSEGVIEFSKSSVSEVEF